MKIKNCFFEAIEYIFCVFLILQTNSVFDMTVTHLGLITNIMCFVPIITFILLCKKIKGKSLWFAFLFLIYFGGFYILNAHKSGYVGTYFSFIITFLFTVLIITNTKNPYKILYAFENIVILIGMSSLFFWPLGSYLHILQPTNTITIQWGGIKTINTYFGLYYEAQKEWYLGLPIYRNTAIFTEAPMFVVNLLIAGAIELFMKKQYSIKVLFVMGLCIVTSLSYSGALYFTIMLLLKYITNNR